MVVGNPKEFAIESEISEIYPRLSLRALGFFAMHIKGRIYGICEPDATLLADLPLNFHPAATRAPAVLDTPVGAV